MSDQNRQNKSNSALLLAVGAGIGVAGALLGQAIFSSHNDESPHQYSSNGNSSNYSSSSSVPIRPTDMCVICQDRIDPPMEQLPCGHLFHQKCIIDSLKIRQICPICRIIITSQQMRIYLGRMNELN